MNRSLLILAVVAMFAGCRAPRCCCCHHSCAPPQACVASMQSLQETTVEEAEAYQDAPAQAGPQRVIFEEDDDQAPPVPAKAERDT